MSKVKFNKNDAKQVGALGLHIMGINDMPADKWLSYFTSDDIKNYAMNDEQGFIGRLPPLSQERVMDLLTVGIDGGEGILSSASTKATIINPNKGVVITDKGVFVSVEVLKDKLSRIYIVQNFEEAWVEALTLSKIDADVDYLSPTAKKLLLGYIKSAILSAVERVVINL
jgi:hypothetical protein